MTKNQKLIGGTVLGIVAIIIVANYVQKQKSKKQVEAARLAALNAAKSGIAPSSGFNSIPNMTVMEAGQQAAEDWRMKAVV